MKYYEGIDYFVKRVDFPNMASPGLSISNGDGTFTILINSLFCQERQQQTLCHEVSHLTENHFFRQEDVTLLEREAKKEEKRHFFFRHSGDRP